MSSVPEYGEAYWTIKADYFGRLYAYCSHWRGSDEDWTNRALGLVYPTRRSAELAVTTRPGVHSL